LNQIFRVVARAINFCWQISTASAIKLTNSNMQRKIIEMLAFAKTDQAEYTAGEIYSVPENIADRFVREKLAKYLEVTLDDEDAEDEAFDDSKTQSGPSKPWPETVRPGDIFQWQVTLKLPHFDKPRIHRKYRSDDYDDADSADVREAGGDGSKPSTAQAKAIDHLAHNEAKLYPALMSALADYSKDFRADWTAHSPVVADQVVPPNMTAEQAAERIAFTQIYVSGKSRDGIAYVEISGECAWDPEHGFKIVLHRDRIVEVTQQGAGWNEPKS
jgi:hypothetical protein